MFDFLALTAALWFVGGARSPFTALYLLHVIVATIMLPGRGALLVMGLAYALLSDPRPGARRARRRARHHPPLRLVVGGAASAEAGPGPR